MSEIAIVVVNYNTCKHLHACLTSIVAEQPDEIVVVDNASSDGSVQMVRTQFPIVTVLANQHNPGYGAAANQGLRATTAPYVLLLNSDTRLCRGSLASLRHYLDQHQRAAVVGPRLLNTDGSLQPSCFPFPTPLNILLEQGRLGELVGLLPLARQRYLRTWAHDQARVVPWVLGAALALRRTAFEEVGGFDEAFFMYQEEVDLCYRLRAAGWATHFTPDATLVHDGGVSTAQQRVPMARRLFRSTAAFYARHYAPWRLWLLGLVLSCIMLARLVRDKHQMRRATTERERRRLDEDTTIWRQVLADLQQPRARRLAPAPAQAGLGEQAPLRRLDWRFVLPAVPDGGFELLVLLGGPAGLDRRIVEVGLARRVCRELPARAEADAVVVLAGTRAPVAAAARSLRPGGVLYWEVDRRSPGTAGTTPARLRRALERAGLTYAASYWVKPDFGRCEMFLPLDHAGTLRWYILTIFVAFTPLRLALEQALRWCTGLDSRRFAPFAPCFAVTAVAGAQSAWAVSALGALNGSAAVERAYPLVLTDGGNRAAILPFVPGAAQPAAVLKVPKLPSFNSRTENEQRTLGQIRALLDPALRGALPEPLGSHRRGTITVAVESYVPGHSMLRSSGRWPAPPRRKLGDLYLPAEWLARFHQQAQVRGGPWGDAEIAEWVEAPLEAYAARFGVTPVEERLFARWREHAGAMAGTPFRLVWQHRDFTISNAYRSGEAIAVIDWEGGRVGPPLCDLLHFVIYWNNTVRRARNDDQQRDNLKALFCRPDSRDPVTGHVHAALGLYLERLALAPSYTPLLLVYLWVELALRRADQQRDMGAAAADPRAGNRNFAFIDVLARDAEQLFAGVRHG